MTSTIVTMQDALDATDVAPRLTVYVGGVLTAVASYSGEHQVGRSAVGRLQMPLPVGDHVTPGATVEVQAGYDDLAGVVFSGYVPNQAGALSGRGATLDVTVWGWSKFLDEPEREDIVFDGPVALDAVFAALCERKGVPSYIASQTTYVDGETPVMLGGNLQIDDGQVVIRADQSPLAQLQRIANDYGYFVTDAPTGPVVLHRVSGLPVGAPVITFEEGLHLTSVSRSNDAREIVNYHDVQGQVYEDQFGALIPIRSRPAAYVADPLIPGGVRRRITRSNDIVRQDQADAIRQRLEIDTSEPATPVSWSGMGVAGVAPGDAVRVESAAVGATGACWLMGIRQTFSSREGFAATFDGWAGAGQALPSLVERTEIVIDDAVTHLGDEYVAWYAHPASQGSRKTWQFTLPERATHVNVRAYAHSWNSQLQGGANADLNTSTWQIWEPGADRDDSEARPLASGTLPVMSEDYRQRPNFATFVVDAVTGEVTDAGRWKQTAVSLSRLEPGDYELDLVSGKGVGLDDGEVRRIRLEVWGASEPAEAAS